MALSGIVAVLSFVGLIFVWRSESSLIIHSETVKLLSLLFSDFSVILSYWKEYLLSLAESLPVVSVLAVVFFLWITCTTLWLTVKIYLKSIHQHVFIKHA